MRSQRRHVTLALRLCVWDGSTCLMSRLEVTGQLMEVSSLLPWGCRDLTGHQAWWQVPYQLSHLKNIYTFIETLIEK